MEAQSSSHRSQALALAEPISPELVLVTPGLRTLAIAELWEDEQAFSVTGRSSELAPATPEAGLAGKDAQLPMPVQIALYAVWQAVTGALFGLGAFTLFIALILLKPFLAG
jgi:hypothetical protein